MKLFEHQAVAGELAVDFYPTPSWMAHAMVERAELSDGTIVLEPTCGDGAILEQMPSSVTAIGVEIDPILAARASASTGRDIIVGDILSLDLPSVDAVVANPPYQQRFVEKLFDRMHGVVVEGGVMVMLLSAHMFQTANTVVRYSDRWSLTIDLLPRDVYPGLQLPLVLATMRKNSDRKIVGMAFIREVADLRSLPETYRTIFKRSHKNVYVAAAERALREIGRPATIDEVCSAVEGRRPTDTRWWREALRRALAQSFVRIAPGTYALPEAA